MTDLTKTCCKCKKAQPLNFFQKRALLKDGLAYSCKPCVAQYYKTNRNKILDSKAKWRKTNADAIKKYQSEYEKLNAEKIAKYQAEYQKNNKDKKAVRQAKYKQKNAVKIAKYNIEYQQVNAEKIAKQQAAYWKANPNKRNAFYAKYRATKLQATPTWLTPEHLQQMQLIYAEAKLLSDRGFKHHVDHIVPLQGKTVSGLHVPWNLRAIPASANLRKNNATPDKLPTVRYF